MLTGVTGIALAAPDLWPMVDAAIYAGALAALTFGGNPVCLKVLDLSGIERPRPAATTPEAAVPSAAPPTGASASSVAAAAPATSQRAGRVIGVLERLLIVVGLVAGSWEIIAAVIALKTVGRFKELDERLHAEYFLVGSFASIAWAALGGLALLWFDANFGFDIAQAVQAAKAD